MVIAKSGGMTGRRDELVMGRAEQGQLLGGGGVVSGSG
jgi:hypothetical protein